MKRSKTYRAIALFLATVLFLNLWIHVTVPVLSAAEDAAPYVMLDGETVQDVTLESDAKLRFEAISEQAASAYQWQIRDPAADERWINISGGFSRYLWVTHSLIGSMMTEQGTAQLRCRVLTEQAEQFTEPVTVSLSLKVPDAVQNTAAPTAAPMMMRAARAADEHVTYSIVINYLFDDNTIAFEPYGASVAKGSDFKASIKSPEVVGYDPFRRVGDDYISAATVDFDLTNIQQNITINVIYEPALVEFSVHHHLQHVGDDEYSVDYDLITTGKALTGSTVGDGLALTEAQLPGFKALAYEKLTVAADGSTVIEIRYDRNYYLIDFDMNGGYGSEPLYTRYGATVGANTPIRHGYVFDGWELVSYAGQAPTTEQQAIYALQTGGTIEVPAANLTYRARWIAQQTTYTMVFWCENADDDGYSYWGYLDDLPALSGSYVDGQHYISRVEGIDDEQYFTFNQNKTDKNVLVEGDGSTIVNVYYTRNYYSLTFKAPGLCSITPNHRHTDACYDFVCGLGHVHNDACLPTLQCSEREHEAHTAECLLCTKEEHTHNSDCDCQQEEHTHAVKCWSSVGSSQSYLYGAPSNPPQGYIYRYNNKYYIYLLGRWYRYNGRGVSAEDIVDPSCGKTPHTHGSDCACEQEEHTHGDTCYRDGLHTHTEDCYSYSCGLPEHVHEAACKRLHCGITEDHSHNDTCKNTRSTNTVKTVYAKYGQSIKHLWPVTDDNGKVYNSGQRWHPKTTSTYYKEVLVYISKMPPDDFTLTLDTADYKTFTMNYYLQVLDGDPSDDSYDGKQYKLDNTIKAIYNHITKAEDFFDIGGFVQAGSNPAFDRNNQITTSGNALTVNFYYDRITDHYLRFNNNGTVLDDRSVYGVMYGAPLKQFNFEPPYPDNLEPNAYTFKGWYISPGCFDGTEVNWDTLTSPEGDLMLYAKWVPVTHTVRVFTDDSLTQQIGPDQIVDHQAFANAPAGNVTNGNLVFQGWFYKDVVNGETVEKAFAFNGIPVVQDMDIYAKWSSHVSVDYKIYYKLKDTDIEIADPTFGSAIAGHNKTFNAKAEQQLYQGYQTGYYPVTNSHTITMSVNGPHEFVFEYVFVESMPYRVQYINAATGLPLCDDKVVEDNSLSVVTETFKRFDGMMPDAYQKRLVLAAKDADGDGVYDDNVITFYYTKDTEHAYYRVVHYIQNISGDTYREYRSEEAVGVIGGQCSVTALMLTGFAYDASQTVINGKLTPTSGDTVTTTLNADGTLIELYYTRQSYDYVIRFLNARTYEAISEDVTGRGVFGEQLVAYAKDLSSIGYQLVSDGAKTFTVSANVQHNVIEFLYQENTVSIKYQIVGPAGCGVLTQESENLTAISGEPIGSQPIIQKGFIFRGWFTDEACTNAVNPLWIDTQSYRLTPQRTANVWQSVTYYAKVEALETELTVTVRGTSDDDAEQVFIFRIVGKDGTDTAGVNLTVTVVGNASVTVTKLPVGDYTVTELTDWSWRYQNGTAERPITLAYNEAGNQLFFDNTRDNPYWLDGNAVKNNRF